MNMFSLVPLVCMGLILGVGCYTFSRNPRSVISRVYLTFSVLAGVWSLTEFGLHAADTREAAEWWLRAGSFHPVVAAMFLHFVLTYTGRMTRARFAWLHPLLHVPGLVFLAIGLATGAVSGALEQTPWGWRVVPVWSPVLAAYAAWLTVLGLSAVAASIWFVVHIPARRANEGRALLWSVLILVVLGGSALVVDRLLVLPVGLTVPSGTVGFLLLTVLINRNDMFRSAPGLAADDILAAMPEGLAILSPEGRILRTNPALESLALLSGGTLSGAKIGDLVGTEVQEQIMAAPEGAKRVGVSEKDGEMRRGDGTRIPVRMRWVSHAPSALGTAATVVLIEDRRERVAFEDNLRTQTRLEAVQTLAQGLAHDHGNVLTALMGELSLVRSSATLTAGGRESLDSAERAGRLAGRLVSQLRSLGSAAPGYREPCDVPELVRQAADLALHGHATRLQLSHAEMVRRVDGDADQLVQVFMNLMINARQAMGGEGSIAIHCRNAGMPGSPQRPCVEVTVRDTGPGIDSDTAAKLFDPFFTTRPKGNGLGLAIVQAIVGAHGGEVAVSSSPGDGATFTVSLPCGEEVNT